MQGPGSRLAFIRRLGGDRQPVGQGHQLPGHIEDVAFTAANEQFVRAAARFSLHRAPGRLEPVRVELPADCGEFMRLLAGSGGVLEPPEKLRPEIGDLVDGRAG